MRSLLLSLAFASPALLAQDDPAPAVASGRARVLFVTQSSGFVHPVVKRVEAGKRALAERELIDAAKDHFVVECTQDVSTLTRDRLERFACVVFYTTGALPMPKPVELVEWVKAGGGFVGVHSATDTFYDVPEYGRMIGGYFDGHPWHEAVDVVVEQPRHPITAHLGERFSITDEIYQFKDWSRDGREVLMRLDGDSVEIGKGKREDGDYALAWCSEHGKGRVFYNALGHRHEVWADARFLRAMVAGIRWAMGGEERFAKRPVGAVALFDGSSTAAFEHPGGKACTWRVAGEALEVVPGTGSIITKDAWRDFVLHVGFMVPEEDAEDGNSGVYLQRRYEVQILARKGCGSIYRQRAPDVDASRPPGAWQDYWIAFRSARFDEAGIKQENARITVVHNGIIVHDDVELTGKTGAGEAEGASLLPLLLQDHGARVRFRNVWLLPR